MLARVFIGRDRLDMRADAREALVTERGAAAAARPGPGAAGRGLRGRPRDPGVDAAVRAAVMGLLAEAGYARLTMDRVAERAGVSKDSLYRRWPNKAGLVADALEHRARAVPEIPDTGSLPEDVRVFLAGLLASRQEASRALAAVAGEISTNPELRQAWHRGLAGTLTRCMRVIVSRAAGRGELPAGSDEELLAQLPLSLLQTWRVEHGSDPDAAVVERIVAQFYTPGRPGMGPEAGR